VPSPDERSAARRHHESDEDAAERRAPPADLRSTESEIDRDEECRERANHDPEQRVRAEHFRRMPVRVLLRDRKDRVIPEDGPRDHGGDDARDHDHREGTDGESADDLLEREECPRQRRVEGGGDGGGGAGGDEEVGAVRPEAEDAGEVGSDRGAEHRDGPLGTDRSTAADGDGGGDRAGDGGARRDAATGSHHAALDVRDGHPLLARCEPTHDPPGRHHGAGGKDRTREEGCFGREPTRRPREEREPREVDQLVEGDDAERPHRADRHGEAEEHGVLGQIKRVEPRHEAIPGRLGESARNHDEAPRAAQHQPLAGTAAMTSISTRTSRGRPATATVLRAGRWSPKWRA
jgi:hypothetical protein